jgi:hypothetical protein
MGTVFAVIAEQRKEIDALRKLVSNTPDMVRAHLEDIYNSVVKFNVRTILAFYI